MEDSMRKLKELQHRNIPTDHNCGDPNCPHLANIHPLEMLSIKKGLMDPSLFVLDFTKWKPFDYPLLSIDNNGLQKLSIATYKLKNVPNAFRVIINCKLNNLHEYVVPRDFDFVEALYFTGEEISDFNFSANSSNVTIKPTRNITFLGWVSKVVIQYIKLYLLKKQHLLL